MTLLLCLIVVSDADADGYPDEAELREEQARELFRDRMVSIAVAKYLDGGVGVKDCSDFLRFCYREALKKGNRTGGKDYPAGTLPFSYDDVPLIGHALFRTAPGRYEAGDGEASNMSAFADAKTIVSFSAVPLGKDVNAMKSGDFIAFEGKGNYHLMLYFESEGERYFVYHTGPAPEGAGEMRLVRLSSFMDFPDPAWRPVPDNVNFLGCYRWKILD